MKKDEAYYKKEIDKLKEELFTQELFNEKQSRIINKLIYDRDNWQMHYAETLNEYYKALDEYHAVINSKFWTISDPIRNFLDNVRGTKKEFEETIAAKKQSEQELYQLWIENNENEISITNKLKTNPLISVIIPVHNNDVKLLKESIESVINQTYLKYQLIIVDDKSDNKDIKKLLNKYKKHKNVELIFKDNHEGISEAINDGLKIAEGDFVGLLEPDDLLSVNALYEVARAVNENKDLDYIYSDEDMINLDSDKRFAPYFKPDFSPDTELWTNYMNHFSVYRKKIMKKVGLFRKEFDGAYNYDYVLRFLEHTDKARIVHISKVLYHSRSEKEYVTSDSDILPKADKVIKNVKLDTIRRRKLDAYLDENDMTDQYQIYYNHHNELVSIIIPSKDNYDVLKVCIDSVINKSAYKNYEIIVVDNGSNDENKEKISNYLKENNCLYIYQPEPFNFSHMCNVGVKNSKGGYLLFLNDDTEVLQADWLDKMLGQARQKHTGAVGVKLLYPNSNIIQHCGIANYLSGPSTYFTGLDDDGTYYYYRNKSNHNCVAVTGACVMLSKKKFDEINGFNENFPNNYNDLDLCFKLLEKGYYNICLNQVKLYHYESLTRKEIIPEREKILKVIKERNLLYKENPNYFLNDPYYSINLSQKDNMFNLDAY